MKTCARCFAVLVLLASFAVGARGQDVQPLDAGRTYSHALGAAGTNVYELSLDAGWFVAGRVDQDGVDVVVTITGPDEAQVARFASPVGAPGPESFQFSTEVAGRYRIEVAPASAGAVGPYRIRVDRSEPVATTPEGKLDQAMAMFRDDTPGAVVAVLRGGEVAVVRSYGSANLTHGIPFTERTVTNIGSTSKQFTGFALALLEERGQLSLDDDVRDHIPELVDFGEVVTLRHLLTHTSGYREFVNTLLLGGRLILEGDHIEPDEVIEVVRRQPRLQNSPGAEFNYNNTAFGLLTRVVERVTGRPFGDWMADEVFGPLGMENTVVRMHPGQIVRGRAAGYVPAEDGFREVRDIPASRGAGGIYTTVGDLARWMGNLATGGLGGPEVIRALTTPYVLTDGDTTSYGLGIFVDVNRGLTRWQHGGADVAHRSIFVYYPDLEAGYVVLSNYAAMPGSVANLVAESFFGAHMEPTSGPRIADEAGSDAEEAAASQGSLERYVGRYELVAAPGVILTISVRDGALLLALAGQPELTLSASSDSTFRVQGVDAHVTFHGAADEEASAVTLHQEGDHRATRLPEVVPVADLSEYAGRYFSEELETFYVIAVEGGQLAIRHRRFGPALLDHAGGDAFTGTLPVTHLEFDRDPEGRITGFHAGNGRARDIWFERFDRERVGSGGQ